MSAHKVASKARSGMRSAVLLAVVAVAFSLATTSAFFSPVTKPKRPRKMPEPRRVLASSVLTPASAALMKPSMKRLLHDVAEVVRAPYRFVRLARITQKVVAEAKAKGRAARKAAATPSRPKSGATSQMEGMVAGWFKSNVAAGTTPEDYEEVLSSSINVLLDSVSDKDYFKFQPYHQAIRGPDIDFYNWGNNFFKPLIIYRQSKLLGLDNIEEIKAKLAKGENVIFLANHQSEGDPQVLSILLELFGHEDLAERCIFVAGHKVTTDPIAVPFSMGRNLLTIFSKKYLDTYSGDEKVEKAAWNQKTVSEMQRLLTEGGKILWVAPSGGRDRRSPESGEFEPARFDHQSVGLFELLARKAQKSGGAPTHFFPLAMWTHGLMPAPEGTQASVGEARKAERTPVGILVGDEIVPKNRKAFPALAETTVQGLYSELDEAMKQ